ncbi:MAG: hypothetical protein AseanaTS_03290 [Candidatus Pelagadaptatus aseana]|uniref:GNAT family N-acetyltransferase n=1 Tax=Candidatus Pelagadaptatus aseana TaxID=3120508 RepID=UPI0039B1C7BB
MDDIAHYQACETLKDGSKLLIRAVLPEDKAGMQEAAHHLSDRSSYLRFFRVKHDLTPQELKFFTEVDFVDHVGLTGVICEGEDQGEVVAASRYVVCQREPKVIAELAFAVDDPHQGLGIGKLMLKHLVAIARQADIDEFEVSVLAENRKMLRVLTGFGLPYTQSRDRGVVELRLSLRD